MEVVLKQIKAMLIPGYFGELRILVKDGKLTAMTVQRTIELS